MTKRQEIFYAVAHRPQWQIDAFKTRYDDFDESAIPQIVFNSIGLNPTTVSRSTSAGSSHVVYFLEFDNHDDLVFRANISMPEPEVAMLTEKYVTDLALKHDIRSNEIIYVDITRQQYDFDFTIQTRLGGIDPEDEFTGTKQEYEQFTFETGQNIAKLSEIELPGFGRFDEKIVVDEGRLEGDKDSISDYLDVCLTEDIAELVSHDVVSEAQGVKIADFFAQRSDVVNAQQGTLCHYDLADHNLRYSSGHLEAIFDWETAVVATPALDLASCPTWKSHFPKREKLIEGFTSIKPLPENFIEIEHVYLLRTMIWKMRYAIRANILNEARTVKFRNALKNVGLGE